MVVIRCQHLVLATGGPGELYRDSVYPVNYILVRWAWR